LQKRHLWFKLILKIVVQVRA